MEVFQIPDRGFAIKVIDSYGFGLVSSGSSMKIISFEISTFTIDQFISNSGGFPGYQDN